MTIDKAPDPDKPQLYDWATELDPDTMTADRLSNHRRAALQFMGGLLLINSGLTVDNIVRPRVLGVALGLPPTLYGLKVSARGIKRLWHSTVPREAYVDPPTDEIDINIEPQQA